jgi:hypothetical protein
VSENLSGPETSGPEQAPQPAGPNPVEHPGEHPILNLTFDDVATMLRRTVQVTAIAGAGIALFLWIGLGWQTAALFAVGAAISVASIYEWGRLIRIFNAAMDGGKTPRGTGVVVALFLVRMIVFGVAIYGSLKCFQGSPIALICGLGLALLGLVWQSIGLIRG